MIFKNTSQQILTLISLLTVAFTWPTAPALAQNQGDFELVAGAGLIDLDEKLGGDSGLGLDLRFGYFFTDRFALEIQATRASSVLDGSFTATTLNAVYHLGSGQRFVPYVLGGVGQADVELDDVLTPSRDDSSMAWRAALGLRVHLGWQDRSSLRLELSALNEETFDEGATHLGLTASFGWRFGKR